ncbi:MAG: hypothetical protein M3494_06255 [Actinomycetota bacterium]|nr:hypothetical protein [Actinomycetota bacterium]
MQTRIVSIAAVFQQAFQQLRSREKLIPVLRRKLHSSLESYLDRLASRILAHPRPCLGTAKHAEFQGASSPDAAQLRCLKLLIVLEFQPIKQAVPVAVVVDGFEQFLAFEAPQLVRAEAIPERPVIISQPLFRKERAFCFQLRV